MGHFGHCKYCGSDLIVETYKKGRHGGFRMLVYCDNDNCDVKPCSNDDIPSDVMEEVKYFAE